MSKSKATAKEYIQKDIIMVNETFESSNPSAIHLSKRRSIDTCSSKASDYSHLALPQIDSSDDSSCFAEQDVFADNDFGDCNSYIKENTNSLLKKNKAAHDAEKTRHSSKFTLHPEPIVNKTTQEKLIKSPHSLPSSSSSETYDAYQSKIEKICELKVENNYLRKENTLIKDEMNLLEDKLRGLETVLENDSTSDEFGVDEITQLFVRSRTANYVEDDEAEIELKQHLISENKRMYSAIQALTKTTLQQSEKIEHYKSHYKGRLHHVKNELEASRIKVSYLQEECNKYIADLEKAEAECKRLMDVLQPLQSRVKTLENIEERRSVNLSTQSWQSEETVTASTSDASSYCEDADQPQKSPEDLEKQISKLKSELKKKDHQLLLLERQLDVSNQSFHSTGNDSFDNSSVKRSLKKKRRNFFKR